MSIEEIRDNIKDVDERILKLLAERMALVDLILEEKKKAHMEINNEKQNDLVIKRAMERASEMNLDPGAVREVFNIIIRMSIARQREMAGKGNLP